MCARQQGDLCNYRDKCDDEKGLYCDLKLDAGLRGVCRGTLSVLYRGGGVVVTVSDLGSKGSGFDPPAVPKSESMFVNICHY